MTNAPLWFHCVELAASGGALLVHLALKATLLLLILWAVTVGLRRSSAAVRHALWFVGCLGLLILPLLAVGLPAWQVNIANGLGSAFNPAPSVAPSGVVRLAGGTPSLWIQAVAAGHSDFAPVVSGEQWFFVALFACWLLGLVMTLRKLAMGFVVAKQLQHQGRVVNEGFLWDEFAECASSLSSSVSAPKILPRLVLVDDEALPIPLTWGCWRPVVLMPSSSLHWAASCRRAAFLHELAHIRRFDWFLQSLASLTCLLYWFHPLVWFAAKRLRLESERATDDQVLASGFQATDYSSSLLEIVRFVASHQESGLDRKDSLMKFAVPMSGTSKIETRLRSILDPKQKRSAVTKKMLAVITLIGFATVVPLAAAKQPEVKQPELAGIKQPENHTVTGFQFTGNTIFTQDELQKLLISKTGVSPDRNNIVLDKKAIHKAYADKGIQLRVKEVAQNGMGVIIYELQENPTVTDSEPEDDGPIFVGEGSIISRSFIHRRGYANYIVGSQPSSQPTYMREVYATSNTAGQFSISRMSSSEGPNRQLEWHTVTGFEFSGNKAFKADELQKLLVSKIGVSLDDQNVTADAAAIQKAYADKGLAVQVQNAALNEKGIVTYTLLENHVITGFKFNGNEVLAADALQKVLASKAGTLFTLQGLAEDRRTIVEAYANTTFSVVVRNATQDEAGIVSYTLQERELPQLTQIQLVGLMRIDPDSIRKLIMTQINKPYNTKSVRDDMGRIFDTNLFSDLNMKVDDDPNVKNGVILTFLFKEKNAGK